MAANPPRPAAVHPRRTGSPRRAAAIVAYARAHPQLGYTRLTYQLADAGDVAVSPSAKYTILKRAGLLERLQPVQPAHRAGTLATFDVYDARGRQVATASTAIAFLRSIPLYIRGDNVYGVVLDSDDVPYVVRARIVHESGGVP